MKLNISEGMRRAILFAVIVITGSVMVLFDVPLLVMIPLVIVLGFAILIALGALTIAEIQDLAKQASLTELRKISFLKKLDDIKFFEKKDQSAAPKPKTPGAPQKKPAVPVAEGKTGPLTHIRAFISSVSSLGTVISERSRRTKKVEDINKLLDKTITEKVSGSALASAGKAGQNTAMPAPAGCAGSAGPATTLEADPFLSLSGDEFDAGLLDGLDDLDAASSPAGSISGPGAESFPDPFGGSGEPGAAGPETPLPPMDFDSAAGDILKDNAAGLEEFSGLDGGDSIDSDFGDLDNLNLDDISLEDEAGSMEENVAVPAAPAETASQKTGSPVTGPAVKEVKTDWIESDAPQGGNDSISTQADMAAFSSGTGADEDLLSSIASDVKHVKKEKDVSLLRELKDFKAPADEIEKELAMVYERLQAIPGKDKKPEPGK